MTKVFFLFLRKRVLHCLDPRTSDSLSLQAAFSPLEDESRIKHQRILLECDYTCMHHRGSLQQLQKGWEHGARGLSCLRGLDEACSPADFTDLVSHSILEAGEISPLLCGCCGELAISQKKKSKRKKKDKIKSRVERLFLSQNFISAMQLYFIVLMWHFQQSYKMLP